MNYGQLAPKIYKILRVTGAIMKHIQLTQGQFAIVSDRDYLPLIKYKWHALNIGRGYVACRMDGKRPNRIRIYMHRQILCVSDPRLFVDHKNHCTLDNQRSNIRIATAKQNRHNSRGNNEPKSSKYKGVSYDKRDKVFVVQLAVDGRQRKVGRSKDELTAAKIYNQAALKYYGRFAYINEI